MKVLDCTGIRFNDLTIIHQEVRADSKGRRESHVRARCKCGKIIETKLCNIRTGHTRSCGCLNLKRGSIPIGYVCGQLTVISQEYRHNGKQNMSYSECLCTCGVTKFIQTRSLKSGSTKSCGCLQKIVARKVLKEVATIHGLSSHPSYHVWVNMNNRCYKKLHRSYKDYGDRGIEVCDRWRRGRDNPLALRNFYDDFGQYFKVGTEIDRIDTNKGYHLSNVQWVAKLENNRNTRKSKWYYIDGKRYESCRHAAKELGISFSTVIRWCEGYKEELSEKVNPPRLGCCSEVKYPDQVR